ncbi:MAG: T9SS type A sorting domain-containing protein [Bacteroidia bacterium]|nr:T9SS type A sorting domain-containing protein [Bacteroidia bacterium]
MKKIYLLIFTLFLLCESNFAQYGYRTVATGNWNNYTTWERYNTGTSTWNAATSGQIPGNMDTVYIQQGHTLSLTQNESCVNIAFQNSSGVRLILNDFILTVSGSIAAFTNTAPFTFPLTYSATINFTIQNGAMGFGKIKFTGNTRNIFTSGQWGANPQFWNCEFALNTGAIATLPNNFKAGRIIVSSGTLIANGDLRADGGTNAGDVIITPNATLRVNGNMSRTGTVTSTFDSIDVSGTFEIAGTSSNQNISAINFNVNNGGKVVKINKNALVTTITNRNWATGSSLTYAGTETQTVGGEFPATTSLPKVIINNSGTAASVNFSGNRYILDTLIMTSGNISLGNMDSLTLGINKTAVLQHSSGSIIGKFNRYIAATTLGNVLFPVGSTTYYRPLNANFVSSPLAAGNISVAHVDMGTGFQNINSFTDGSYTINRASASYWEGSVNNGFLAANIYLTCTLTGQGGILNASETRIIGSTDGGATFGTPGGSHVSGTGFTAYRSGFQTSSPLDFRIYFGGNSITNPLPVQLKTFTATKHNNQTILNWSTVNEKNSKGFEILRSTNQSEFESIGFVKSATTNSNILNTYNYTDARVIPMGNVCYKLKQMDWDGNTIISKAVCVNFEGNVIPNSVHISPNPFTSNIAVQYTSANSGSITLQIINLVGKILVQQDYFINKGENTLNVSLENLSEGIYYIQLESEGNKFTKRIIKK